MSKGITYFATDSHGNTYTRYSASHAKPIYTWAVAFRQRGTTAPVGKGEVSYSSRRELAITNASRTCLNSNDWAAKRGHTDVYRVYDLMEVRAYAGRLTSEPQAAQEAAPAAPEAPEAPEPAKPTQTLYGELQTAFDYFNATLWGGRLRHVVITLKCKPNSRGHYACGRFVSREDQTITSDEIAMNPVAIGERSVEDTLSTLVHEMVHLAQAQFGQPAKGAHHNKQWGDMMREVGLYPSSTGQPGGKETGNKVSHYIIVGGRFHVAASALILTGFGLTWADGGAYDRKGGNAKQGKRVKYVCPECGQAAWAKHGARLICGDCEQPMEAQ
jgi:predicted SprT family Zn-dependent metalloprotease/ribosomal protein S27AE